MVEGGMRVLNDTEGRTAFRSRVISITDNGRQAFIDGLVQGKEWASIAFILSDKALRAMFEGQIGNISILLPADFDKHLGAEANYLASEEFRIELMKFEEAEKVAKVKVQEALQEQSATMKSADELDKIGFEVNPRIAVLKGEIADKEKIRKALINTLKEENKGLKDNDFKTLNTKIKNAEAEIAVTEQDISKEKGYFGFGTDEDKLKKLDAKLEEQKKSLNSIKAVKEKLSPIGSEIKKLRKERDKLVEEDATKLASVKASAENIRTVATTELGGTAEVANAGLKSALENKINFEDSKKKYIADHSAKVTKESSAPIKDIKKSLAHLYMGGRLLEVATYLFEGAGKGNKEFSTPILKAVIKDGRQDAMTLAVARLGEEARLSFVNELIERGEIAGLKGRLEVLKIAPNKQIEVGRGLLDGELYKEAYEIMGVAEAVKHVYEGKGKGKGLSLEFVKAVGSDGDELDKIIAEVAKLGDDAKDLLVNDLIKIKLQGLKSIMGELGMAKAKQDEVGRRLLDNENFAEAYEIMEIKGVVEYVYADKNRGELSDGFMRFAIKNGKLDEMVKAVASLGDAAKDAFVKQLLAEGLVVGLKTRLDVLGIKPENQMSIAQDMMKYRVADYGMAYNIMNGNGKLEEFHKVARDRILQIAVIKDSKPPEPVVKTEDLANDLRLYAASFPNKKEGSEIAGKLLANSIITTMAVFAKQYEGVQGEAKIDNEVQKKINILKDSREVLSDGGKDTLTFYKNVEEVDAAILATADVKTLESWKGILEKGEAKAIEDLGFKTTIDAVNKEIEQKGAQKNQGPSLVNQLLVKQYAEENKILKSISLLKKGDLSSADAKINLASILCDALKEIESKEGLDPSLKVKLKLELNEIYNDKCRQEGDHKLGAILNKYSEKDNAVYNALKVASYEAHHDKKALKGIGDAILYAPNLDSFTKTRDVLQRLAAKDMKQDFSDLSIIDMLIVVFAPVLALFDVIPNPQEFMDAAAHVGGLKRQLDPGVKEKINEAKVADLKAAVNGRGVQGTQL